MPGTELWQNQFLPTASARAKCLSPSAGSCPTHRGFGMCRQIATQEPVYLSPKRIVPLPFQFDSHARNLQTQTVPPTAPERSIKQYSSQLSFLNELSKATHASEQHLINLFCILQSAQNNYLLFPGADGYAIGLALRSPSSRF